MLTITMTICVTSIRHNLLLHGRNKIYSVVGCLTKLMNRMVHVVIWLIHPIHLEYDKTWVDGGDHLGREFDAW